MNEEQLGGWYSLRLAADVGNEWKFNAEIHDRNWNILGDLQQFVSGIGIQKTISSKGLALSVNNFFFLSKEPFPESNCIPEYRVHQEISIPKIILKRLNLNTLLRIEERFIQNQPFRLRTRLNQIVRIPLNNEVIKDNTFYLEVSNEVFLNPKLSPKNANLNYFDFNRLYFGSGYKLSEKVVLELGIMNQTSSSWSKNQLMIGTRLSI